MSERPHPPLCSLHILAAIYCARYIASLSSVCGGPWFLLCFWTCFGYALFQESRWEGWGVNLGGCRWFESQVVRWGLGEGKEGGRRSEMGFLYIG